MNSWVGPTVRPIGYRKNGQPIFPIMGAAEGDDLVPDPAHSGIPLVAGGNPAWNDVLQYIPEDKRQDVVPKLQEWDKSYQQVQTSYKNWKDLDSQGVDPEAVQLALQVTSLLDRDPRKVYEALGAHLGVEPVSENGEVEEPVVEDYQDPRYDQLASQVGAMSQIMLSQREEDDIAKEERALERELKALETKHGSFDESEVLMRMEFKDMSAEDALQDWLKTEDTIRSSQRPVPTILGGGGRVPSPSVDTGSLDSKSTKELVAQMISHANQQNRQ